MAATRPGSPHQALLLQFGVGQLSGIAWQVSGAIYLMVYGANMGQSHEKYKSSKNNTRFKTKKRKIDKTRKYGHWHGPIKNTDKDDIKFVSVGNPKIPPILESYLL